MNEHAKMDTQEFADCLDRWGSDLEIWPPPQRAAGKGLLAASEIAIELLAEAHHLDRWLASTADHQAPIGLERRILNQLATRDSLQRALDWFSAALWRPALAATCMLLVGFTIGIAIPEFDDELMLDDVSMLAFNTAYGETDDALQDAPYEEQRNVRQ